MQTEVTANLLAITPARNVTLHLGALKEVLRETA